MRNKSSIYPDCNPQLARVFKEAGHPAKLLCVPLDYAKGQHTALICDGNGEVLKPQFCIDNNNDGVKSLVSAVRRCAKKRKIKAQHVFFGGEDCPSFAENFLRQLRGEKFLVIRVNAGEAKAQRDNNQASNDGLDLLGIARCLLKRKGKTVQDWPQPYASLRIATRDRDKVVRLRTLTSNRIHSYVDRIFPGFLDPEKSGLAPFGEASLELMSKGVDSQSLRTWAQPALSQWLGRREVEHPNQVAHKLKALAKLAPQSAAEQSALLQNILRQTVTTYKNFDQTIEAMDRQLAYWLARTPGAFLTSTPGMGITLAASWMAELGPVEQWQSTRRLCSYGGVVPRSKQTGGPQKPTRTGKVTQCANKRFKNALLYTVLKVRQHGPPDLLTLAQRLENQGSHVEFAMAKRLVRLCKCLVTRQHVYRPKAMMASQTQKETLAAYYLALWPKLVAKWTSKAALKDVFDEKNPLGQWRKMVQELYTLKLPLPRQRTQEQPSVSAP